MVELDLCIPLFGDIVSGTFNKRQIYSRFSSILVQSIPSVPANPALLRTATWPAGTAVPRRGLFPRKLVTAVAPTPAMLSCPARDRRGHAGAVQPSAPGIQTRPHRAASGEPRALKQWGVGDGSCLTCHKTTKHKFDVG